MKTNYNFAKLNNNVPTYAHSPLQVVTHHHEEYDVDIYDDETGEPTGEKEHIVSDWDTLQGWLAEAKSRMYWAKFPEGRFSGDWVAALVCHALYWSLITFLPVYSSPWWPHVVVANAVVHAAVDHAKANCLAINLRQDQILHLVQIAVTYLIVGSP